MVDDFSLGKLEACLGLQREPLTQEEKNKEKSWLLSEDRQPKWSFVPRVCTHSVGSVGLWSVQFVQENRGRVPYRSSAAEPAGIFLCLLPSQKVLSYTDPPCLHTQSVAVGSLYL